MEERDLLLGILAATDAALTIPRKNRTQDEPRALIQARRRYQEFGARPSVPSGRTAEKAQERTLDRLVREGMLTRFRRRADRTAGFKLSDETDWTLRATIAPLAGLNETLGIMRKLAHLLDTEADNPESSVPECELLSWRWGAPWPVPIDEATQNFLGLEWRLAGAMVRGWVKGSGNVVGNAWYSLTPAGRAVLAESPSRDEAPEAEYDEEATDAYCDGYFSELRRILSAPIEDPQEIFIPLPVGIDWRKPGAPDSLGHRVEGGRS